MDIELNRLSALPMALQGDVRIADDPDSSLAQDGIRFPDPFRIDGEVRLDRGHVLVRGRIEGSVQLECGRCLGPIMQPVALVFEARYAESGLAPRVPGASPSGGARDDDDGVELTPEDMDVSFLAPGTTTLKAAEVIREQVLLEVPIRPLCRPDCQGLCPRCGAARSAGCDCPGTPVRDIRLAALAEIKARLDGSSGGSN